MTGLCEFPPDLVFYNNKFVFNLCDSITLYTKIIQNVHSMILEFDIAPKDVMKDLFHVSDL